jgi:hypothetical protein
MSTASHALQQAVYSRLASNSVLTALLGSIAIFDDVPRGQSLPYIRLGQAQLQDWSTADMTGYAIFFTLSIHSEMVGMGEAASLADHIETLLADQGLLPLIDYRLVHWRLVDSRFEDERGSRARRATLRYRALVERV